MPLKTSKIPRMTITVQRRPYFDKGCGRQITRQFDSVQAAAAWIQEQAAKPVARKDLNSPVSVHYIMYAEPMAFESHRGGVHYAVVAGLWEKSEMIGILTPNAFTPNQPQK